ncbi:hypothetical protein FEF34_24900 [Streptomyces marianii]|uniref:Uncharacterized protein n=1 Tax=Streptomyces marianii TaxID=1817406 RepID=A0A5R9E6Z0_9ACTN|nr:hypothetical protein FEF34_24900 [Streptomyces marianii]
MPASPAARTSAPPRGLTPSRGRRRAPRTAAARPAAVPAPDAPAASARSRRTAGRADSANRSTGEGPGTPMSAAAGTPAGDSAGEVVRWATFGCVVVPVVLVAYDTSVGGAVAVAAGLAAVTGACRALMRRSERAPRRIAGARGRRGGGRRARPTPRD